MDIYPLVIIKDRYTGVYSGGKYTAWNIYLEDIPQAIEADDVTCFTFWHSYDGAVGLGNTPNEAVEDLRQKLGKPSESINKQLLNFFDLLTNKDKQDQFADECKQMGLDI